jgi:hypothetical protein
MLFSLFCGKKTADKNFRLVHAASQQNPIGKNSAYLTILFLSGIILYD